MTTFESGPFQIFAVSTHELQKVIIEHRMSAKIQPFDVLKVHNVRVTYVGVIHVIVENQNFQRCFFRNKI